VSSAYETSAWHEDTRSVPLVCANIEVQLKPRRSI